MPGIVVGVVPGLEVRGDGRVTGAGELLGGRAVPRELARGVVGVGRGDVVVAGRRGAGAVDVVEPGRGDPPEPVVPEAGDGAGRIGGGVVAPEGVVGGEGGEVDVGGRRAATRDLVDDHAGRAPEGVVRRAGHHRLVRSDGSRGDDQGDDAAVEVVGGLGGDVDVGEAGGRVPDHGIVEVEGDAARRRLAVQREARAGAVAGRRPGDVERLPGAVADRRRQRARGRIGGHPELGGDGGARCGVDRDPGLVQVPLHERAIKAPLGARVLARDRGHRQPPGARHGARGARLAADGPAADERPGAAGPGLGRPVVCDRDVGSGVSTSRDEARRCR